MIDYSFLRLKPTIKQALDVGNSPMSKELYNFQIHLLPCESYLQISNIEGGIAFDNDYKVEIINCKEEILADVTQNVTIYEFIDKKGFNQIAFELAKLGVDFGFNEVLLKITHTTGIDIYYSNLFVITADAQNETSRFDYKRYNDVLDVYNSIRLNFWFDNVENDTEVSDYYQITNGNTVSNRALYKQNESFKSEYLNRFTFERANMMLISDVLYIDAIRVTNKPQIKAGERIAFSNLFEGGFSCYKDYNDTYTPTYQITDELGLISKSPIGNYTLASLPNEISVLFNRNVTLGNGNVSIYNSDTSVFIASFNDSQLVVVGNLLTIDITGIIITNGNYKIVIDSGLIGVNCERLELIEWEFIINDGFYDKAFYDTNNYA